ncbi:MAG: hypothetical protein PGN13_15995 [Patulibacter minatonensis]
MKFRPLILVMVALLGATGSAAAMEANESDAAALFLLFDYDPACGTAIQSDEDRSYYMIAANLQPGCPTMEHVAHSDGTTMEAVWSGDHNAERADCKTVAVPLEVASHLGICNDTTGYVIVGGRLIARPKTIPLSAHAALEHLRWRTWGVRLPRATGRFTYRDARTKINVPVTVQLGEFSPCADGTKVYMRLEVIARPRDRARWRPLRYLSGPTRATYSTCQDIG